MTRVLAGRTGRRFGIWIQGHAEGSPQMCAAISALAQALESYIELEPKITVLTKVVESGEVHLDFEGGKEARAAYWLTVTGLVRLEASDPERVEVRVTEEGGQHDSKA